MKQRIDYRKGAPEGIAALRGLESYVRHCGLPSKLVELVKMRASQINGCAHCLDMHSKDARSIGETEQRLYGLAAWRETPYFTSRERAALAFTEEVTLVAQTHVPAAAYQAVAAEFSQPEVKRLQLS